MGAAARLTFASRLRRSQPEFGAEALALSRLEVDAFGIASDHRDQARVHLPEPQRRHVGQQEHAEVAGWQLRRFLEMAQALVAPSRIRVVVGMALQVE